MARITPAGRLQVYQFPLSVELVTMSWFDPFKMSLWGKTDGRTTLVFLGV